MWQHVKTETSLQHASEFLGIIRLGRLFGELIKLLKVADREFSLGFYPQLSIDFFLPNLPDEVERERSRGIEPLAGKLVCSLMNTRMETSGDPKKRGWITTIGGVVVVVGTRV